ncbi:hypothetical protein V8C86DRAFT_2736299 [Haematococcus lacustris]
MAAQGGAGCWPPPRRMGAADRRLDMMPSSACSSTAWPGPHPTLGLQQCVSHPPRKYLLPPRRSTPSSYLQLSRQGLTPSRSSTAGRVLRASSSSNLAANSRGAQAVVRKRRRVRGHQRQRAQLACARARWPSLSGALDKNPQQRGAKRWWRTHQSRPILPLPLPWSPQGTVVRRAVTPWTPQPPCCWPAAAPCSGSEILWRSGSRPCWRASSLPPP